jgi:hypothetical protein
MAANRQVDALKGRHQLSVVMDLAPVSDLLYLSLSARSVSVPSAKASATAMSLSPRTAHVLLTYY